MSNPRQQQQQQSSGFRSGPIRSVGGGGPPSLSSGLAVNRNAGSGGGTASLGSATRPNNNSAHAMTTAAPVPSAPRHPYDAKTVQQSYDPFAQQQRNVSYNISNVAAPAPPAPASSSHPTNFTPDNSAQLQPHIVSLPPSPAPQPPIMQQQAASVSNTAASSVPPFQHPLQPQNTQQLQQQQQPLQQQQGLYQARSHPAPPNSAQINQQQHQSFAYSQQQYNQPPPLGSQAQQQQAYQQQQPATSTTQQQQQQQTMYNQNQTQQPKQQQSQQLQQQRKKQPTTPDEDLDAFLSSTSGIMTLTRPRPLPSTNGVLSKSKLLASRRAWGDVIRVTNDALIVRNMDGGGGADVGKHHSYYSEIVACAKASGPSSPTKMSHSVAAATANATTDTNSSTGTGSGKASSPNEIDEIQKLRRETCELIVLRFIAHLKLRRYVDLGKEISMLGLMPFLPDSKRLDIDGDISNSNDAGNDDNDNNDEHHLAWKEGSIHSTEPQDKLPFWVPYGLRILAVQQLQYNDGSSKTLDVLLDMRDRATRTEYWNSGSMEVWKSTIDNAIVNTCIRMREWRLALYYLEEMINGLHEGVDREVHWWCCQESLGGSIGEETRSQLRELITSAAYVELLSRQILILLQSGAIAAAEAVQGEVSAHATKVEGIVFTGALSHIHKEFALIRQVPARKMTNDGLISFAQSDYELAAKHFRGALKIQDKISSAAEIDSSTTTSSSTDDVPSPPGYPSWKDLDAPTLGFDADASLSVDCINNLSLCLLCTGNMRAAVQEMETLIRKDPCANLTEGLAFNLCTLYELSSDGEECTRRKKRLQRVSKRFFLHDIGVESFRLN